MDYPIIFSAPMVRALLDGRKTMTRRIPTPTWRKVAAGDRLWVRENYYKTDDGDHETAVYATDQAVVAQHIEEIRRTAALHKLSEEWQAPHLRLRPSIHMPRWSSRLTLVVTATKVERLQDISVQEVRAEGCEVRHFWLYGADAKGRQAVAANVFRTLWESLHGVGSWEKNPELVALNFTVHKVNIDQMKQAAA